MARRTYWATVLLLVLAPLSLLPRLPAGSAQDEGRPGKPERKNGIYYLRVRGAPREMGRQHGAAFRDQIRAQVAAYRTEVGNYFGKENAAKILGFVLSDKANFRRHVREHLPEVYEEVEGLAAGAGVPLDDVLLLNMYEEVYEGAPAALGIRPLEANPRGKCTTLLCAGRRGRPNVNAQNMDYTPNLDGAQLVTHYTFPGGRQLLLYTFVGQVGGVGVNSSGLSLTCNTLVEGSKREGASGLGGAYVTRGLLRQKSVGAALRWLKAAPVFGALNYSLADHDKAVMAESSPKGAAVLAPGKSNFLAHTNHMLKLDDRHESLPEFPKGRPVGLAADNTLGRLKAADARLTTIAAGTKVGQIVKGVQAALTSEPINNKMPVWLTLQSVIVVHDRGDLRMYASAGDRPDRSWNVYRFD